MNAQYRDERIEEILLALRQAMAGAGEDVELAVALLDEIARCEVDVRVLNNLYRTVLRIAQRNETVAAASADALYLLRDSMREVIGEAE